MNLTKGFYVHLFGWLFYLCLITFYKWKNMGYEDAIIHSLIVGGISMMIFYGYGRGVVRRFLEKKKYLWFLILSALTLLFFFHLRLRLDLWIFPEFYDLFPRQSDFRARRFVFIVVALNMLFSLVFHLLEYRIIRDQEAQKLLAQHSQAQLSFLKAQINPHFLFNALNNIYSLSLSKSDATPKMVLTLSDLLRYSIYEGRKELVLLSNEIDQIHNYFSLFRMSKEIPPNIAFTISGQPADLLIEPMILIPLVENCFKHSDLETNPNGFVIVNLDIKEKKIQFQTVNSKNDSLKQKDTEGGVGLENIRERLRIRYPENHHFRVKNESQSFTVELSLKNIQT